MKKKPITASRSPKGKIAKAVRRVVNKPNSTGTRPVPAAPWINDRLFRTLIENSSDAIALSDTKGKVLYRSPSAKVISGLSDSKILSASMFGRIWPEDLKPARRLFAEMLAYPGKKIPFQLRVKGKKDKPKWIDGTGVNWLAKPGLGALVFHFRDVTVVKEAAAALEESERRYRSLFENARLAVFQSTLGGKVIRVNNEFARMFGFLSPEDVLKSVIDVATDLYADPSRRKEIIRLRKKDPALALFENLYRRKDGSTFWGRLYIRSAAGAQGTGSYLEGFIEDITIHRAMEEALRESEEKFRSIFQNSAAGVALVALDGRYLMVNPVLCDILGYSEKELLATDFFKLTHPDDMEISRKAMLGVLEGKGKSVQFDKRYLHKDGHPVWTEVSSVLVSDANGKPSHFISHVVDITRRKQAEEALRVSEEKYRLLVETADDVIVLMDLDGKFLFRNSAYYTSLGFTIGADVEMDGFARVHPGDIPFGKKIIAALLKTGTATGEYRVMHRDGHWVYRQARAVLLYDGDHKPESILAVIRDVTERKQAEATLRESEERYRALFQDSLEGIGLSKGNQIIDANKALLEIFGYDDLAEFTAIPLLDHVAPSSRAFIRAVQEKASKGEPSDTRFTYQILRKDRTVRDVEISLDHVKIGSDYFAQSTFRDVTERKLAEEALRDSEERYRLLIEQAVEGILLLNPEGKFIYANSKLCEMLGYTRKEMLRLNVLDTYPEALQEEGRKRTELIRAGQRLHFERPIKRKDGTLIMIEGSGIRLENGNMQGTLHEITERKRAEEALRDSEERYRLLFELSPDSISVYQDGKVLYANSASLRLLGFESQQEIIGKSMLDFVHPDYRDMVIKRSRQQEREGKSASLAEEKFIRRDGSSVDVEVLAAPFQYRGKVSHLVISRDITERKRADEMLREKEARFRGTFENANVGVCIVGLDGRLIQVNRQMCAMFGYTREEMERMTVNTIAVPEDSNLSSSFINQAIAGETDQAGFDKRYIHKDGHVIWGHVSSSIVRDSNGNPLYFISHVQDITDRKQAEQALRESEEKFEKLFQDAPVLIIITDLASGECLDVNEEALRVFGYRRDEVVGKKVFDLGGITRADRAQLVAETQSRGRILGVEMNFRAKDGRIIVGLFRGERISFSGRECLLGAMVDVTERKQAEGSLRALALRHEALLSAIPEIVMEVDEGKLYTWANPAGKEFFGEDVIGKEAAFYFEGEQDTYAAVQPLFNGSEDTIYVESWQRRKDGQKRLLAWWSRALKDNRGQVTGALSSARDITEQRTAEERIRNLSRFPEENPNPVMRMTPDGILLYANPSSRPFLIHWNIGIGQPVPEECRTPIREVFASREAKAVETHLGERIFRCTVSPIVEGGYVNVYARDITDRRLAEEEVARQTEELRQRNLELARVNELTERRLQQLAAMRTVDMAISSSFKSELVMEILLEQLTGQLKIHAADILVFHPAMQGFRFFCGRGFYSAPSSSEYLRLADSYAGRAAQERRMIKVPRLDEKTDQPKIFPKIAKEGFVAYACLPLIAKGQIKGVMEVCHRDTFELGPEEDSFLEMLAGQAAIALDNAELFGDLQSSRDELQLAFNSTLAGWARALELRNHEAEGETQRGADLAMRLAQMMGESDENLTHLFRGAILHDIGMMSIPDDILLKRGPLTDGERTIVREHPQIAFDILSPVLFLRPALDIPHCHHERWDGSGYPRGLKGEHIPLAGRIFAVVDVWTALHSDRPYRKAWTDAAADEYIRNQAGKQFDPAVVQAFFRLIGGR